MLGDEIAGLIQLDLDRKVAQNAGYISFFYMRPGFATTDSVCRCWGMASVCAVHLAAQRSNSPFLHKTEGHAVL